MIEQLVFGYDEGHRLLGGSIELSSRTIAALLGATDAAPGTDSARLVTALPLIESGLFALCFTWRAPEVARPGAVWSHVLLANDAFVGDSPDPFCLAQLARKPSRKSLKSYRESLDAPNVTNLAKPPLQSDLLEEVLAAVYVSGSSRVVEARQLSDAEAALAAVWRLQWPSLRARFAFRTRASAKDATKSDVVVATRLRGEAARQRRGARPPWIATLAQEALQPALATPLSDFIRQFGALDRPEPATVGRLAPVFAAAREGRDDEVIRALVDAYPSRENGQALKWALLSEDAANPGSPDHSLNYLLKTTVDAWDELQLHLPERISVLISHEGISALTESLVVDAGPGIQGAVRLALEQRHNPADLSSLAKSHLSLATDVVKEAPDLLNSEVAWQSLNDAAVAAFLSVVGPGDTTALAAALNAGHVAAVVRRCTATAALSVAARRCAFNVARATVSQVGSVAAIRIGKTDKHVLLLLAALGDTNNPAILLEALCELRSLPDEIWLRAAVNALAMDGSDTRQVLSIVFAPLHEAMTSNRLPQDCWEQLGRLLPTAPDPAQRLRRFLVATARNEHWSEAEFRSAIADAGPFTSQLLHDFGGQDEWYVNVVKSVIRKIGNLRL